LFREFLYFVFSAAIHDGASSTPIVRPFALSRSISLPLRRRPEICQTIAQESLPKVEPDVTHMTRILAIEPNPERAQALRQLVHDRLGADVVLAESTAAAIAAMTKQAADLILTSILLPPNDDSQLTVYLRECDEASTVPVLLIPPVVKEHQIQPPEETWWSRLAPRARRGSPPWPPYDAEAVAGRIRDAMAPRPWEKAGPRPATVTALVRFNENDTIEGKPRAERWAHTDLPWLSSVNLSTGREVKLLNISSSGILVDSEFKLAPGRPTEFQLWGPYKQLVVAARIVRSEESTTGRGARYLTAAAFDFKVDLKT
jgi:CheY-like chemotaxis protein